MMTWDRGGQEERGKEDRGKELGERRCVQVGEGDQGRRPVGVHTYAAVIHPQKKQLRHRLSRRHTTPQTHSYTQHPGGQGTHQRQGVARPEHTHIHSTQAGRARTSAKEWHALRAGEGDSRSSSTLKCRIHSALHACNPFIHVEQSQSSCVSGGKGRRGEGAQRPKYVVVWSCGCVVVWLCGRVVVWSCGG